MKHNDKYVQEAPLASQARKALNSKRSGGMTGHKIVHVLSREVFTSDSLMCIIAD